MRIDFTYSSIDDAIIMAQKPQILADGNPLRTDGYQLPAAVSGPGDHPAVGKEGGKIIMHSQ